jgi:hypothetical protein
MANMTTLGEVSARVENLSRNCTDHFINVPEIAFDDLDVVKITGEPHRLRTIAQKSIAYRLAIPLKYLKRCPKEVQAFNVNFWIIHEKNEQLFFRFDGQDGEPYSRPDINPWITSRSGSAWKTWDMSLTPKFRWHWTLSSCL